MSFLYTLAFSLFALLYLPTFLIKGKHRSRLRERFGSIAPVFEDRGTDAQVVWIHGVSVGEMVQAVRLGQELKKRTKGLRCIYTTTTLTGYAVAEKWVSPEDALFAFPLDFRFAVRKFCDATRPDLVVILETELWPNLLWELFSRRIPVYIANGRISDEALTRYRLIKPFLRHLLPQIDAIGAQDALMQERFVELGAKTDRVHLMGSLKYDWQPSARDERFDRVLDEVSAVLPKPALICVAGSTHEGEEAMLLGIYARLKRTCPGLALFLAPRHLHRNKDIESCAKKMGIQVQYLSQGPGQTADGVWLLDTMGSLPFLYAKADLVVMGGSFVKVGGHNLVEPAYFDKPILFGPYMNNFRSMAKDFLNAGAAVRCQHAADLEREIEVLAKDSRQRERIGKNAGRLVQTSSGALERTICKLQALLAHKRGGSQDVSAHS